MNIIYAKYNRERLDAFQISTLFIEDEAGKRFVLKKALNSKAQSHIENMYDTYKWLKRDFPQASIVKSENINNCIKFDYLYGKSLDKLLVEAAVRDDHVQFDHLLKMYLEYARQFGTVVLRDSMSNDFFLKLFGHNYAVLNQTECVKVALIDLIFDNLIMQEDHLTMIDYEWVYPFPLPLKYILYRSIYLFYYKYQDELRSFTPMDEVLKKWGITESEITQFDKMEKSFQEYVMGHHYDNAYAKQYLKSVYTLSDLEEASKKSAIEQEVLQKKLYQLTSTVEELKLKDSELLKTLEKQYEKLSTLRVEYIDLQKKYDELKSLYGEILHYKDSYKVLELENQKLKQIIEQELKKIYESIDEKKFIKSLLLRGPKVIFEEQLRLLQTEVNMLREYIEHFQICHNNELANFTEQNINLSKKLQEKNQELKKLFLHINHLEVENQRLLEQNHINFISKEDFKRQFEQQMLEKEELQRHYEELQRKHHETVHELKKYK